MAQITANVDLGSVVTAGVAGWSAWLAHQAHRNTKTRNGKTLGKMADDVETRRIEPIPPDDRTPAEAQHVADIPPLGGSLAPPYGLRDTGPPSEK